MKVEDKVFILLHASAIIFRSFHVVYRWRKFSKRNVQNQVSFEYIEMLPIERNFNPVDGLFSTTSSNMLNQTIFPTDFRYRKNRKMSLEVNPPLKVISGVKIIYIEKKNRIACILDIFTLCNISEDLWLDLVVMDQLSFVNNFTSVRIV